MATVFLVQCLLFADGGITALGTNIDLMGLVTVVVGWTVFKALQAVLPKRLSMVAPSAGIAALVSVPAAAACFVLLYAVGGTADLSLGNLATAMVGVHVLIGIGEAVITFLAVGSIIAVRPDLVYGARPVLETRELEVRTAGRPRMKVSTKVVAAGLLLVALLLAGVVSRFASSDPDGLTKVAEDKGFADTEKARDSPVGGYGAPDRRASASLGRPRRLGRRAHLRRPPARARRRPDERDRVE